MAENILIKHFGLDPPDWIGSSTHQAIMFGSNHSSPGAEARLHALNRPAVDPHTPHADALSPSGAVPTNNCSGPFGSSLPEILQNRPSGTPVPDFFVMAAPFTPFSADGTVNTTAVAPLAHLFKNTLGMSAVWVMGMRGQYDTLTVAERKALTEAWVDAGSKYGLFTIIHVGSSSIVDSADLAAHAESVGADAIAAIGPTDELCTHRGVGCVIDFLVPVASAAPSTPLFYYHTNGWNGVGLNGVSMYDFFPAAQSRLPTLVGTKFESYNDAEFLQTCKVHIPH